MNKKSFILLFSLWMFFVACENVPKGRIKIKNDSQDSTYNIVKVSGGGAYHSLKPGDTVLLPRGTTSIYFSRAYKEYTRSYHVTCPPLKDTDAGVVIKLIDVHLNRMRGGCKTDSANKG